MRTVAGSTPSTSVSTTRIAAAGASSTASPYSSGMYGSKWPSTALVDLPVVVVVHAVAVGAHELDALHQRRARQANRQGHASHRQHRVEEGVEDEDLLVRHARAVGDAAHLVAGGLVERAARCSSPSRASARRRSCRSGTARPRTRGGTRRCPAARARGRGRASWSAAWCRSCAPWSGAGCRAAGRARTACPCSSMSSRVGGLLSGLHAASATARSSDRTGRKVKAGAP